MNTKEFQEFMRFIEEELELPTDEEIRDETSRAKKSIVARNLWQQDEYKDKLQAIHNNEELRNLRSFLHTQKWQDQHWKESVMKLIRAATVDNPEWRQRNIENIYKNANDPVWLANMDRINKERANDPKWLQAVRDGVNAFHQSEKGKQQHKTLGKRLSEKYATDKEWVHKQKRARTSFVYEGTNIKTGQKIILIGNTDAEERGFTIQNISACVRGKRTNHAGYTWIKIPYDPSVHIKSSDVYNN